MNAIRLFHTRWISLLCAAVAGCSVIPGGPIARETSFVRANVSSPAETADDITGFHSHFFKADGLEFRLLEADHSITVARNPLYVFAIITNNASGPDLIFRRWDNPIHVSRIDKVVPIQGGLRVHAWRDDLSDQRHPKEIKGTFDLIYHYEDGRLDERLEVVRPRGH